jgi:hypothetical protein
MNSYQMVLHRPVETARLIGNLPASGVMLVHISGQPVFRPSLTMSALSSDFCAHDGVDSEELFRCALWLKNPSSLTKVRM